MTKKEEDQFIDILELLNEVKDGYENHRADVIDSMSIETMNVADLSKKINEIEEDNCVDEDPISRFEDILNEE